MNYLKKVLISTAVGAVAAVGWGQDGQWTLYREMAAAEANQAAAALGDYIYGIGNKQVVRYDRSTGAKVNQSSGEAHHLNSGFFMDGKLYLAHSNYSLKPDCSDIKVLDPATMQLTIFKDFGESDGSLTWATYHEGKWWCNFAFYGKGNNTNTYVACFDSQWQEQQRWFYPQSVVAKMGTASISGGIWREGCLWVCGHDDPEIYRLELPQSGNLLVHLETIAVPFKGQGFAVDGVTGGLIGIDRAAKKIVLTTFVPDGVETQNMTSTVSDVEMRQRDYSREVEINYKLTGAPAIITLAIEVNGVAIPDSEVTTVSGDVCKVVEPSLEMRTIIWNAGVDWAERAATGVVARVIAHSLEYPPQYSVVDLTGGIEAEAYPVYFYPSSDGVPNGVTNHLYKTNRLLLRRIEATPVGGFLMGSPSGETGRTAAREARVTVELSRAFYAGVYQVTQRQWELVMGDIRAWPSYFSINFNHRMTRPVEQISYHDVREDAVNNSTISPNWPQSKEPGANSFMGRLCAKAGGILTFDLPTDAQWEWACRAGTTGALNDGTVNIANSSSDPNLDLLGRYERNGGKIESGGKYSNPKQNTTTNNGTANVGSYLPNAWGLYDMHGNVWEWCLDWFAEPITDGIDPVGPPAAIASGNGAGSRLIRGGSWSYPADRCRSAMRRFFAPETRNDINGYGLRVFAAPVTVSE